MLGPLSVAIGLAGVGDLLAIWRGRRSLRYLFKPGTMFLIIALAAMALPSGGTSGYLVLAGLICSVAGDIFLVLPPSRFLVGLAAFFVAHLLYIAAFALDAVAFGLADGLLALALLAVGLLFFGRVRPGVIREGGRAMLWPVGLYVVAISLMVLAAASTRQPGLVAGALLFFASDAILAWNRFVRPLPLADLGVMSSYFAAQYLIAVSLYVGS